MRNINVNPVHPQAMRLVHRVTQEKDEFNMFFSILDATTDFQLQIESLILSFCIFGFGNYGM